MKLTYNRFLLLPLLAGLLLISPLGCSGKKEDETKQTNKAKNEQGTGDEEKTAPPGTPAEEAQAALGRAAKLLEDRDYKAFVEEFTPMEELKEIQEADEVDEIIAMLADLAVDGDEMEELIGEFRLMQKLEPVMSANGKQATFRRTLSEEPETPTRPDPQAKITIEEKGYGSDLKQVITQSLKDLDAGNFDEFIDKLYPKLELQRLAEYDERKALLTRLQPSKRDGTPSPMVQAMQQELNTLQNLTPKMEGEDLAVFTIVREPIPGTYFVSHKADHPMPPRVIKFQKVGEHWRFHQGNPDNLQGWLQLLALQPEAFQQKFQLELIKVNGKWRLLEYPY